jgi:uncharacterized membrane protein
MERGRESTDGMVRRILTRLGAALRHYFVAGVVFIAPIAVTVWAVSSIVVWLDNLILPFVLRLVIPGLDEPPRLPLLGMLFTFLVIILIGVIARHLLGGEFTRAWEGILSRVPVARSIYSGVKQLFEAVFAGERTSRFRRVVLIEYPREGVYALAFVTGAARGVVRGAPERTLVSCFLPTTPNPTSGYYLLLAEEDLIETDLGVEDAFKLVMSAGLVPPPAGREVPPVPTPMPGPNVLAGPR